MKKPHICIWKDLPLRDVEKLERAESSAEVLRLLSQILHLEDHLCLPSASALLDLYYYTVRFCWDSGFTREQTSCLFSIVKETHATCIETSLGNMDDCYRYFKEMLLCHAVHRPPFSVALFTQQQVLHISEYILNTYFRHFKLYKYVFTPQLHLDLSISYEGLSEPQGGADTGQEEPHVEQNGQQICEEAGNLESQLEVTEDQREAGMHSV
ncbi:cilia- and flagella-associated protein 119 [Hyperolius riggenbachi]|uniref:cilia- and flagella-associated protein 119 n=1 Tax=Hyperolius riggenbachi TaxID=752182 RepID=UPI0035A3D406